MTDDTTREGVTPPVNSEGALSFDDAVNALIGSDGAEELPEDDEEGAGAEDQEETSDEDADTGEHDEDDTDDDGADPDEEVEDSDEDSEGDEDEPQVAPDGAVVEVTVDGQTHKVSVNDLKRLYGQEAALTRKSQEVADLRKVAQQQEQKYVAAMSKLVENAEQQWKPYSEIDWLVAPQNMRPEDFKQLREDAKAAYENYQFLTQNLDGYMQEQNQAQQTMQQESFQEAVKAAQEILSDPAKGIPNWSKQTYDGIREYALSEGMPADAVNSIIDPVALKVLWKASQFEAGKKVATTKKAKASAKKVTKSKGNTGATSVSKAKARLQQTGSFDDAYAALIALEGE